MGMLAQFQARAREPMCLKASCGVGAESWKKAVVCAGFCRCHMNCVGDCVRVNLVVPAWTCLVTRPVQAVANSL